MWKNYSIFRNILFFFNSTKYFFIIWTALCRKQPFHKYLLGSDLIFFQNHCYKLFYTWNKLLQINFSYCFGVYFCIKYYFACNTIHSSINNIVWLFFDRRKKFGMVAFNPRIVYGNNIKYSNIIIFIIFYKYNNKYSNQIMFLKPILTCILYYY